MNQKIKELSTKARLMVNEIYRNMEEEPEGDFDVWYHDMVEEKFAELIIRECVEFGLQAWLKDNTICPTFPSKAIKEHFGVE